MKLKALRLMALCALSTAGMFSFGCDLTTAPTNQAPAQLSIFSAKCYVASGKTVQLVGSATDGDDDPLTFQWSATAGTFTPSSGAGATVTWTAPGAYYGPAEITMTVSDGFESASRKQTITVCELLLSATTSRTIENTGRTYITRADQLVPVSGSARLTIEPGVTIVVERGVGGFDSYGEIVAEGTPSQKIRFIPNNCAGEDAFWNSIVLRGAEARGVFRNCEIMGGNVGITVRDGASLDIQDCGIYRNSASGIEIAGASTSAAIGGCFVWENGRGIFIQESRSTSVRRSSVRYNLGDGIYCITASETDQAAIDSCVVANNYWNGFVLADAAAPSIHYCSIFANNEAAADFYAIKLSAHWPSDPIPAEHNYWGRDQDTEAEIAALIYDMDDNPDAIKAHVSFAPWLETAPVTVVSAAKGAAIHPWAR